MPIIIKDEGVTTAGATAKKAVRPNFFSSKLTGNGQARGLLTRERNPANIKGCAPVTDDMLNMTKRSFNNGQHTVTLVPFYVVSAWAWGDSVCEWPAEERVNLCEFAHTTDANGDIACRLYVNMRPYSMRLLEEPAHNGYPGKKTVDVCYQMMLWAFDEGCPADTKAAVVALPNVMRQDAAKPCRLYVEFTMNPADWLDKLADRYAQGGVASVDRSAVADYVGNYSLYDGICEEARLWVDHMPEMARDYLAGIATKSNNAYSIANPYIAQAASFLHRLESRKVPLDCYRDIYQAIADLFVPAAATTLCKQNLNLLLNDTLYHLSDNKDKLTCLPEHDPAIPIDPKYSTEQARAITSTDPLTLVQAGAGTGKSTTILARIDYMVACGIDPADIMVLSFTNSAKDNILERNDKLNSMTFASMIHSIYSTNFPDHSLSTIATLINSLEIYYPFSDSVANAFKRTLVSVARNDADAFTMLNNFVEYNYDRVIEMLNEIGQTTLELEIVICYQRIDTLEEPESVQSKYIIVDEVQDNSIFEFVYTLRYVDKHMESLFIVGDCSQTLYEFRAANPTALNVLEGSGVFSAFPLQTNYRSDQEILSLANTMLLDIEANQYANIQLRANSLATVTADSFKDKVQMAYRRVNRIADAKEVIRDGLACDAHDYLDERLACGEQVCFLAHSRAHVALMQQTIERLYPQAKCVSLVPQKTYDHTYFSTFIRLYWDEVRFVPAQHLIAGVSRIMADHAGTLTNKPWQHQQLTDQLTKWASENRATIRSWVDQLNAGLIDKDELLCRLRRNMLGYEVRNNSIRSSLLAQANAEAKLADDVKSADFLFSTIHSAKGLEFPHVVLSMNVSNDVAEDKKRMYYVGLTRAEKSEFLLAYGTLVNPKLTCDYETLVKRLEDADAARAEAADEQ